MAGSGSRVGGRHGEVDQSHKKMGSGFFGFGLLLLFLASGTEGVGDHLSQGPNRLGGGTKHRPSNKEGGRPTKGTTTDRHEHTPPHWPQNHPTGKWYFCLYLTSGVVSLNCTRPMQGPRQAVCLPGQNFTGSDRVSPPRRAGLGPSRLACHPPSQAWHKALESASTPVGCPVPRQ